MSMRLALLSLLIFVACGKPEYFEDRLQTGQILNRSNEAVTRPDDVKEIYGILRTVLGSIEKKDLSVMGALVHEEKGVWIDLKAEKTTEAFLQDLANPAGYVNTYYLNSEALRAKTGEADQIALYDLIKDSEAIRADLFFQGNECEVRLTITKPEKLESQSYRFNNAYFIKDAGRWYLYRLF